MTWFFKKFNLIFLLNLFPKFNNWDRKWLANRFVFSIVQTFNNIFFNDLLRSTYLTRSAPLTLKMQSYSDPLESISSSHNGPLFILFVLLLLLSCCSEWRAHTKLLEFISEEKGHFKIRSVAFYKLQFVEEIRS